MITADFSKRYLSDEELSLLKRNPEYVTWARDKRCPICDGDGDEPGTYRFEGEEHECPQDDYGHIAIQKAKLYWLHNIPWQYQILPPYNVDPSIKSDLDSYIEKYRFYAKNGIGLTFYSKLNGTGKTWAATYVLKELVKQGVDGWFERFYEVKSYYDLDDREERRIKTKKVRDSGLLVLDEIRIPNTQAQRDFYADQLESLIRPRQDMNFPTIITTNLTPDELEKHFPRVFSLLSAKNSLVEMSEKEDARKGDLYFRNEEVSANGEVWPIT